MNVIHEYSRTPASMYPLGRRRACRASSISWHPAGQTLHGCMRVIVLLNTHLAGRCYKYPDPSNPSYLSIPGPLHPLAGQPTDLLQGVNNPRLLSQRVGMAPQTLTANFLAPFLYPQLFRAREPSDPPGIVNVRPIGRWSRESFVQEVRELDEYEV